MQTINVTRFVIGIILLALVLIPLLPKIKVKFPDLKWLGGWVSARLFISLAGAIIITLTVYEFWRAEWDQFFTQHGWYAWLVLIAGILLFCLLFGRETQKHGTGASSEHASAHGGHGGESHGGGLTFLKFLAAMFVASIVLYAFGQWSLRDQQHMVAVPVTTGNGVESVLIAPTGPNNLASVYVPSGMDMWWLEKSFDHILVHREGEPEMESSRDQVLRLTPRSGPYRFFARAKGDRSVEVEIHLVPARR